MADEITGSVSLRCAQSNVNFTSGSLVSDQAAVGGGNPGMVSIGTAEEDVAFGDVTPGMVVMENLDASNYVEFGKKDGSGNMQAVGQLRPAGEAGSVAYFYLASGATLRMKANTAACKVNIQSLNP